MTQTPNVMAGDAPVGALAPSPSEKGKIRDAKGRMLVVKPLDSLETYRLLRITRATGAEGYFGMAAMAASVQSIDGETVHINTEREIEFTIQQLGNHGLAAVADALAELREDGGEEVKAAKN